MTEPETPAAPRTEAYRRALNLMRVNPEWVGLGDRTPEQYTAEVLDAAVAEAAALAARPALDVERLTRVLWNSVDEARAWLDNEATSHNFASWLAAESARLAPQEPTPEEPA